MLKIVILWLNNFFVNLEDFTILFSYFSGVALFISNTKNKQEEQMQWTPGIYKSKSRIPDWPKTFGSLSTFKKSAQFITSFLGSQELKGHGHFWPHPPQNHWINF